jgi:AcrR family transcriptional regulator
VQRTDWRAVARSGPTATGDDVTRDRRSEAAPADDGWRSRVLERSLETAKKRSLDRSQAFILAAIELLQEKGEGFTLQEVSDRAGYSLRLFYQHFGGKHDLLLAVLEEEVWSGMAAMRRDLEPEPDPVRRLVRVLELFLNAASEPSSHNLTLLKYELQLVTTHPQEVAKVHAPETRFTEEIVAEGIGAGLLHPASAEDGAYFVVAMKRAYNQSKLLGSELGVALPEPSEFIRFCIEGLGGQLPEQ